MNNGVGIWTQQEFFSNHYGQLLIHQLQLKTLIWYALASQESAKLANVWVIIYHVFLCVPVVDLVKHNFLSLYTRIVLWSCCLTINVKINKYHQFKLTRLVFISFFRSQNFVYFIKYEIQKINYRCSSQNSLFFKLK